MNRLFVVILAALLTAGCVTSNQKVEVDPDTGLIATAEGKHGVRAVGMQQVASQMKDRPPPCPEYDLSQVSGLAERAQESLMRGVEECLRGVGWAVGTNKPIDPQTQAIASVARANTQSDAEMYSTVKTVTTGAFTFGGAYVLGGAIEAGFNAAQGDTYNVNSVPLSNSVNVNASTTTALGSEELAGVPGSSVTANGTRTNTVVIGPGNATIGVNDQAPSAQVQNNVAGGQVDKPLSLDGVTNTVNDDDGQNDTSLF